MWRSSSWPNRAQLTFGTDLFLTSSPEGSIIPLGKTHGISTNLVDSYCKFSLSLPPMSTPPSTGGCCACFGGSRGVDQTAIAQGGAVPAQGEGDTDTHTQITIRSRRERLRRPARALRERQLESSRE